MHLERLDPPALDLETADALADLVNAANAADGVGLPPTTGPTTMTYLQQQSDGRPVAGLWVAREGGEVLGRLALQLPTSENTDSALLRGAVHPAARRRGIGRALLTEALTVAREAGRTRAYAGAFDGSPGLVALPALGFTPLGTEEAVSRLEIDGESIARWRRLYDDAAARAEDYELLHLTGPTPPELVEDLVVLHAAINDAPLDDPDMDEDVWDADRVRAYDSAMAARRQTVHRVLARHRATGEWAGMSILCVDEFAPTVAFQEDTSVVRTHRGHRLGLLMKTAMLLRLAEERPEVAATVTWNATSNHHMIAVNELLGVRVVATHANFRAEIG